MEKVLNGKTIAILVANGFEEVDMTEPQRVLLADGAQVRLVSPEQGLVNGWHGEAWGHYFPVDQSLSTALAADFDALLVPGGSRGVAKLAQNAHTIRFLRGFIDGAKPVAMVGDAIALLATADRAAGRTVAAVDADSPVISAGAKVTEDTVVTDNSLLTIATGVEEEEKKQAVGSHVRDGLNDLPAEAA